MKLKTYLEEGFNRKEVTTKKVTLHMVIYKGKSRPVVIYQPDPKKKERQYRILNPEDVISVNKQQKAIIYSDGTAKVIK